MNYFWVSFATDDGPLGVVVTAVRDGEDGDSPLAALLLIRRLHAQGINPGGEVMWADLPEEAFVEQGAWGWLSENLDRLLQPVELADHGFLTVDDLGPIGRAEYERILAERGGFIEPA